jgi:prepilin-type N-terminal cleavage/methylation domain-containing protein
MKNDGFSIIELLVVLLILGALLSIAGLQMNTWIVRSQVEEQIKRMHADFMNARMRAMDRNRVHFVKLNVASKQYEIWEDTNPAPDGDGGLQTAGTPDTRVSAVTLNNDYQATLSLGVTTFSFDARGLVSNVGTIRIDNSYGPLFDCIVLSDTRIRLGRYDGAACIS